MSTIVTRAGKGSALTWTEGDANFTNLNTDKAEISRLQVNVKNYGATGDGSTDDTAAMQLAHNTGKVVYYPAGTYKFTTITMTSGGIVGEGQTNTILNSTNTSTDDLISCTGASVGGPQNSLTFQNFQILGTLSGSDPAKASGAGIAIKPVANENSYAFISNVTVAYVPTCIDLVRASYVTILGCRFLAYDLEGVKVANANNNDSGDSTIIGCTFSCPYVTVSAAGIRHLSSGGLRINNNKFLGGGYGYLMQYTDSDGAGTLTGIVQITNNSIENFYSAAIAFSRISAGLTSFKNVIISGNEFDVALADPTAYIITTDAAGFVQNMTISGNTFQLPGVTNSYGITVVGVTGLNVSGNVFRGNGGTSQAVTLTSCVDAKVGPNVYSNITVPYLLVTPSTGNSTILDNITESTWTPVVTAGSGAITAYTATGKYTRIGNLVTACLDITITTKGTAASALSATLPLTSNATTGAGAAGGEIAVAGFACQGWVAPNTTVVQLIKYDGTTPFTADGTRFILTATYLV